MSQNIRPHPSGVVPSVCTQTHEDAAARWARGERLFDAADFFWHEREVERREAL